MVTFFLLFSGTESTASWTDLKSADPLTLTVMRRWPMGPIHLWRCLVELLAGEEPAAVAGAGDELTRWWRLWWRELVTCDDECKSNRVRSEKK